MLVLNCFSKLGPSRPQSAYVSSIDHGLQVHLWTRSITASQCISEFTQSWSPIASPNPLDHGLGVNLWVHSIVIFRRTLNCSQAPSAASRDIPCVDGYLYGYIDTQMRIQSEYVTFKNRWTIYSSYNFQAHQQCSQRKCCFSQTALLWFEVLQEMSLALPGAPRLAVGAPSLGASTSSYSEGWQKCHPRVWYSPEIDASKFILHILSDTPEGFQWLKYILLMLGALHSLQTKINLVAGKRCEIHIISNDKKEQWIEASVDRETAVGRKQVDDAETAIKQEQDDMKNAENTGLTTTKPETTFEEMSNNIGDSLSNLAWFKDAEDGDDDDDDKEDPLLDQLSEDDEPSWVMGTISKMVQHRLKGIWTYQRNVDGLTHPRSRDAADSFCERDMMYGMIQLRVTGVVQTWPAEDASPSGPTKVGEPMEPPESVPGILQIPRLTSQPGCSHMRGGSRKPHTCKCIPSLLLDGMTDSSPIEKSKPVEPECCHPSKLRSKLNTILKSDSDKEMVMAPSLWEQWIDKMLFSTMYLSEKYFMYQFCYLSIFTSSQSLNCMTW